MKLHFLKTKWSDMIVLTHNGRTALVDTGFDEQYEQLSVYLSKIGTTDIDFILLTHFHRDHYGNISPLIEKYNVKKVYLKEYSGLDCTTAWGSEADDEYRAEEMRKFIAIREHIIRHSELVPVEGISAIPFCEYVLKLFMAENSIKDIYNDRSVPETYNKIIFSENQNSLAIYINADGKNIFLGGDILDIPSAHPLGDHVNLRIAQQLRCRIDVYKAPHHGTVNTGCDEALQIYRPRIAVITNEDAYLSENSDIYDKLRKAYPDVKILLTENDNVVIDTQEI